jgi:hypothetical protein
MEMQSTSSSFPHGQYRCRLHLRRPTRYDQDEEMHLYCYRRFINLRRSRTSIKEFITFRELSFNMTATGRRSGLSLFQYDSKVLYFNMTSSVVQDSNLFLHDYCRE